MCEQLNLFSGAHLRDVGIQRAMQHAENKIDNWTAQAYQFLLSYMQANKEFMCEDVREAAKGIVENPPHNRAWGGIFVKAAKLHIIKRKGFKSVTNAKAHCTPATLWEVC